MKTYCWVIIVLQLLTIGVNIEQFIRKDSKNTLGSSIISLMLLLPIMGRILGWW